MIQFFGMGKNCCHEPLSEKLSQEILSQHGLNKTKVKIQILMEMSKSSKPLSVPEIHELIKEDCNVSTIFRTMTQFKEKNIVQEVNLDEGFLRYELSVKDTESNHHHHHVRCRVCGDIKNLAECDLSVFEKAIKKLGFKMMEHRLEFSGICSKCQK